MPCRDHYGLPPVPRLLSHVGELGGTGQAGGGTTSHKSWHQVRAATRTPSWGHQYEQCDIGVDPSAPSNT